MPKGKKLDKAENRVMFIANAGGRIFRFGRRGDDVVTQISTGGDQFSLLLGESQESFRSVSHSKDLTQDVYWMVIKDLAREIERLNEELDNVTALANEQLAEKAVAIEPEFSSSYQPFSYETVEEKPKEEDVLP